MPSKNECYTCQYLLVHPSYLRKEGCTKTYPCLREECIKDKNKEIEAAASPLISVTKYYFNTDMFHNGDVVIIQELKKGLIYPAILFDVNTDKILAMRDSGENKTSQVIIRPEDVAGDVYNIVKVDWQKCLKS